MICFAVIAASGLAQGCGYKFGETKSNWARSGRTLAIPVFSNDSHEPAAETIFTSAARQTFAEAGGFKLASEGDFILKGRILSIDRPASVHRQADDGPRVAANDMEVQMELLLIDKSGLELWRTSIFGRNDMLGDAQISHLRWNRREALARLAKNMMQRAYLELSEGF